MPIDAGFIATWKTLHQRKETTYGQRYHELIDRVREESASGAFLRPETLREIIGWKSARSRGRIDWDNYSKYQAVFSRATGTSLDVHSLVGRPGFGYPYASTVMHFAFPGLIPIVDVRTIGALRSLGLLEERETFYTSTFPGYEDYVDVVRKLAADNPGATLRDIDMALYAYNKYA